MNSPAPKMTDSEAKAIFDAAIANASTADKKDDLTMLREYCLNPKFRAFMHQATWEAAK